MKKYTAFFLAIGLASSCGYSSDDSEQENNNKPRQSEDSIGDSLSLESAVYSCTHRQEFDGIALNWCVELRDKVNQEAVDELEKSCVNDLVEGITFSLFESKECEQVDVDAMCDSIGSNSEYTIYFYNLPHMIQGKSLCERL